MPNWKKVIVSGSDATLSSLYATSVTASVVSASQFTGSLFGTASWATNTLTASSADAFIIRNGLTETGSINITGSTTQIGNITLTGSLLATSSYISSVQYIDFVPLLISELPAHNTGRVHWYDETKTLQVDTDVTDFMIELGHQQVVRGYNNTGADMPVGTVVYISGSQGNNPQIVTASFENDSTSAATIGLVATYISGTIGSKFGYVVTRGLLRNVNTTGYSVGTQLYLSSSGKFSNTAPDAPLHEVRLGKVVVSNATTGIIYVDVMNGYELTELHDVKTTTYSDGDLLVQSGSLWINSKQLTGSYGLTGSLTTSGLVAFKGLTQQSQTNIVLIDTATGQLYYTASSAIGGGGGSGTPGGSNTQIQYNNSSTFAGVPTLTYDGTTLRATGSFTGSLTGALTGTASWATNTLTASSADSFIIRNGLTLTGSLNASGSTHTITGSFRATSFTGSLQGTSSWATNAITAATSSYPITITGSTLYSVSPLSTNTPNTNNNIFLGLSAGGQATNVNNSNFLGQAAGLSASNANNSNFLGSTAGNAATNASHSFFAGFYAGSGASASAYSTLIGYKAGYAGSTPKRIGSNNIIIGTNITLPQNQKDSINIGGILFGTGSYSTITGTENDPYSGSANGRIGINVVNPEYTLDVSGSGNFTNGVTASLFGTSSWATNALTSSKILGGTTNYIPLWNTVNSLSSSVMFQSGSGIGINTTSPSEKLEVYQGNIFLNTGGSPYGQDRYIKLKDGTNVASFIQPTFGNLFLSNNAYYKYPNFYYHQNGRATLLQFEPTFGEFAFNAAPNGIAGNTLTWKELVRIKNDGNIRAKSIDASIRYDIVTYTFTGFPDPVSTLFVVGSIRGNSNYQPQYNNINAIINNGCLPYLYVEITNNLKNILSTQLTFNTVTELQDYLLDNDITAGTITLYSYRNNTDLLKIGGSNELITNITYRDGKGKISSKYPLKYDGTQINKIDPSRPVYGTLKNYLTNNLITDLQTDITANIVDEILTQDQIEKIVDNNAINFLSMDKYNSRKLSGFYIDTDGKLAATPDGSTITSAGKYSKLLATILLRFESGGIYTEHVSTTFSSTSSGTHFVFGASYANLYILQDVVSNYRLIFIEPVSIDNITIPFSAKKYAQTASCRYLIIKGNKLFYTQVDFTNNIVNIGRTTIKNLFSKSDYHKQYNKKSKKQMHVIRLYDDGTCDVFEDCLRIDNSSFNSNLNNGPLKNYYLKLNKR